MKIPYTRRTAPKARSPWAPYTVTHPSPTHAGTFAPNHLRVGVLLARDHRHEDGARPARVLPHQAPHQLRERRRRPNIVGASDRGLMRLQAGRAVGCGAERGAADAVGSAAEGRGIAGSSWPSSSSRRWGSGEGGETGGEGRGGCKGRRRGL